MQCNCLYGKPGCNDIRVVKRLTAGKSALRCRDVDRGSTGTGISEKNQPRLTLSLITPSIISSFSLRSMPAVSFEPLTKVPFKEWLSDIRIIESCLTNRQCVRETPLP